MAKAVNSFKVLCPLCGNPEGTVRLNLNDLTACECSECGEEFSPADAVKHLTRELAKWQAVARWVAMAPEALAEPADVEAEELAFEL